MFYEASTPLPKTGSTINGYTLIRMIDDTNNSIVFEARDQSNADVALKFIKVKTTSKSMVEKEINIMQEIDNPFVIKALDIFDSPPYKCVVLPYSREGDLNSIMKHRGKPFDEQTTRSIMICALKAIQSLHEQNIWHRDVKVNNFLLFDSGKTVKLCDLGYATHHKNGEKSDHYLGTIQCAAPEIISNTPYDETVDIWSLGVLMFTLLSGSNPFPSFPECTMRRCISRAAYYYPEREWQHVSQSAKDLIDAMMRVDPTQRISVHDALIHPWIRGFNF